MVIYNRAMNPSLLPALAVFVRIAQHRSFSRAAGEMGISRAALSQSLKSLEQRLNVKLIHRTTRDMSLTEEGQRLYASLQPALQLIEQSVHDVGTTTDEPAGRLRINTSRVAARSLLEPHLVEFLTRYPKLELELVMDDGMSNIIADGCDAGIRLGENLAAHMVAVPITPLLKMAVVGSPAYLAAHGKPQTPAELIQHKGIAYRFANGSIFQWRFSAPVADGHDFVMQPGGSLVTNDDESMIRAALDGLGLIQHLDIAVRAHLLTGRLVRVLEDWSKPFPGFYLYVPSREQMATRVRALIDFLIEKRDQSVSSVTAGPDGAAQEIGTRATGRTIK